MQDISLLPEWKVQDVVQNLEKNPLDHKTMKSKLDKIYQISSYNELQYVPDVLDAYCWIKLANDMEDFKKFFPTQRNEKQFYEDFVSTAIRYMIICRKFKNKVLMILTQQIMVQALKLFCKKMSLLQKYLKMINILNFIFDHQKQFYKLNYLVEVNEKMVSHKSISQSNFDDSQDEQIDPEMKNHFMYRSEICTSELFIDLMKIAHNEYNLFENILEAILKKKFNIQATSELISFLMHIHPMFHRKYAVDYILKLTDGILDYVNKGDDITIRNFSKQRYEAVISSVREFLKRVKNLEERRIIVENFQLDLICRFLFSDFLDRKLQAVSILTTFMKYSKNSLVRSKQDFVAWIKQKQILKSIYNEKSHNELISRSSEFLQYYLLQKPALDQLTPLLQFTQPNIKLISEIYDYFPPQFQVEIVKKIKQKENVTNKEALNIIKQTEGCQEWLLKNGGQCWVEVVKQKTKRKADIVEVFKHDFKVIKKITKEISQIYECKFKTEFFLYMNQINYVSTVLQSKIIPMNQIVDFTSIALQPLSAISQTTYKSILPYTTKINDELSEQLQNFFVNLLNKMTKTNIRELFQTNFGDQNNLITIGLGQIKIFKKSFLLINQEEKNIQKKVTYVYAAPNSYRKEKREELTIRVNPNDLIGMDQLMKIVFQNKNIEVTQIALQFIGFLFDHLAKELQDSVSQFKGKFLDSCLQQFYKTQDQQEKYLRILEKLMDQSQKQGCDNNPSVNALFPAQQITIRVIDHFNVNKSKMLMEVPSNLTLYELRAQIGRTINAYVHQMKILQNDQQIDPRLNGHIIHTLKLSASDLIIQKKVTVQKVSLSQADGSLTQKVKIILASMFKQFSTQGLMSKAQCQKYQQRCIGQVTSLSESKVDKIYETYDVDKDGYLTQEDFFKFYEVSVRSRQSAVWSNLQTFGIRNDLQILTQKQIQYPQQESLTRNLLYKNQAFVNKLFELLSVDNQNLSKLAWDIISRLPLVAQKPLEQLNLQKKYSFRYWLYLIDNSNKYELVTKQILRKILSSNIETMCIGLKIAHQCSQFDIQIFNITLNNMKNIAKSQDNLQFYNKVLLDNSLKLFDSCLRLNNEIKTIFIEKQGEYDEVFTAGLMSKNLEIRTMFCQSINTIVQATLQTDFSIASIFFNLVYKNFENCDKSTLSIQYFDLYSTLLEVLKRHPQLLQKLKLNWLILTKSMIQLYTHHQCNETSLNSKPDHVAQGFLRILSKILNKQTLDEMIPLVKFIFQNNLFPEHGQNKLKSAKSRKDAYELVYQICSVKEQNGDSKGLKQLFEAGFKSVYKKMNQAKPSTFSFSYYYNYNEARSELGYSGLRNLGCICYMISMLQQLFMTGSFRNLILMADDGQPQCLVKKGTKQIDDNIFHQLQIMFANLLLTEKQDFNPDEFCFSFKDFEGLPVNVTIQQDAQQFLNIFFDKMQQSLKRTPFRRIFQDTFGGKTCSQTVCSNCKAVKERYENFYPLSLQIKGYKGIYDSFNKYIQGQVISDYQCDFCNKKTDVTKSSYLAQTPNNFIIHLQRMCFNYDKFENQKVNSRWQFPQKLNLYDYTLEKVKGNKQMKDQFEYELKGIVLHYGTADFGHYFSYIKESENQWIQFNDQRVRQFDPRDIQVDCFGGQNWRRQSQSAYLLVYQKIKKRQIMLEFDSEQHKESIIKRFNLNQAVIQRKQDKKEEETLQKQKQEEKTENQIEQNKPKELPKIMVPLNPQKIPSFIPQPLRQKISKNNQQFSFSLNLSNDEFAYFLYKILSIKPSEELTTQYLQLCYECFHLKQIIDEESSTSLSEWAAKRFKQIVLGHGWQFLKNFGKNWQSDILCIQKATRVGIKNLLQCVISDIINSNHLNNELAEQQKVQQSQTVSILKEQKRKIILQFLQKYTEMLSGQVTKHWHRFKQYFQVWSTLIQQNAFVRRYCQQKMMVQHLLDFILEDDSPFTRTKKRYSMGNNYYSAEFDCPLQLITLLISNGYEINDMESKAMKTYAFMSRVINFQTKHFNLVQYLCKDDEIMSQKMAFLILYEAAKVSQSDGIKPIINVIHKFIEIDDNLRAKRIEWIIGFPQYIENSRTGSYGVYGLNVDQQIVLHYFSPVRTSPILMQLYRFKSKAQHVAALLVSMLLQLEQDGHINNLEQYPAMDAFQKNYIYWFEQFVQSYYDDTHRPYMGKHYVQYGNRLKTLWSERPNRPFEKLPYYLIGKSLSKVTVKQEKLNDKVQLCVSDVTSELLEVDETNSNCINKKTLKNFEGSDNFKIKPSSSYSHSTFLPLDRGTHSSDEQQQGDKKKVISNPFDKAFQTVLFRKILIKNISSDNLAFAVRIYSDQENSNAILPTSQFSCEIRGESASQVTIVKKDVNKPFGDIKTSIKLLGKASKEGFWPSQIITPIQQEKAVVQDTKIESGEESNQDWP